MKKTITILLLVVLVLIPVKKSHRNSSKDLKFSGAYESLMLWEHQRAYPNGAIPDAATSAAYNYVKDEIQPKLMKSGEDEWKAIGPHNIGGRTLALAINPQNPNTIYAGSASGGLWVSYTGGKGADAWDYVKTGFPVLGVSSIAIDHSDTNTIYIGTGEVYNYENAGTGALERLTRGTYGIGILKTTDGGTTWQHSLDWSYNQRQGVWAIKIDPQNSGVVWAATTEGVYKTTDGGANWSNVNDVIMATDLVIHPEFPDVVISVHGNFDTPGHGLYRTINGGGTWTKIEQGIPGFYLGKGQLSMCKYDPDVVYASFGNGWYVNHSQNASWLCRSNNGGQTWSIVSEQDYSQWQGWFAHDVGVDPTNPERVFAIGINIWKSTDGGSTLSQVSGGFGNPGQLEPGAPEGTSNYSHADHHDIVFHPTNPDIIYFANDGGVFRTTDGGNTFEGCNGGYQTTQFYNGFSVSYQDLDFGIGGMQDNGTAVYRGTVAWDRFVISGDGSWTAIDPRDDRVMYGSWQGLNVLKSTDRGDYFNDITVPSTNSNATSFIAPFVVSPHNNFVLYAGRDVIYRSANGGLSWTATNNGNPLSDNPAFAMAASHQDENRVYVATAAVKGRAEIYRTDDGGGSWIDITDGLPNRFPTDIHVDPNDDNMVYITFSGYGSPHIFMSVNRGADWNDISYNLPDIPLNAIVTDPANPNHIYAGSDLGVFFSGNGGASWQELNAGLPDAALVYDLKISPVQGQRRLYAATHGNGAYTYDISVVTTGTEGVEGVINNGFELKQNYPNPFNPVTTIEFTVKQAGNVKVIVYDLLGGEVEILTNRTYPKGSYKLSFNGVDLSSGIYYYTIDAGNFREAKKMILLK